LLYRTRTTDLTDPELLLFDILFRGGSAFGLLRDRGFRQQWNLRYSHGLSDDALRETLTRLVARGWLRHESPSTSDDQVVYWLTPEGGTAWERERQPQWHHYATGHYALTQDSRVIFVHCAFTEATIDRFVEMGEAAGLWGQRGTRYRRFTLRNYPLVYWKSLQTAYVCAIACRDLEPQSIADLSIRMSHEEKLSEILMNPIASWKRVEELQLFIP
jgi:DNA-binding HxlR family transcriptional regulator